MKKAVKKSAHDKKADPVKVPTRPAPELTETETPKTDPEPACAACAHAADLHYGSTTRWCNTSGCACQGYA